MLYTSLHTTEVNCFVPFTLWCKFHILLLLDNAIYFRVIWSLILAKRNFFSEAGLGGQEIPNLFFFFF